MTRALRGTRIRIALAALIAIGGAAGVMLLSGGASADGHKTRVTSTDRWLPLAPSPLQRTEVGAARIGRFIYVLGGFVPTPSGATTREVTRYDIDANEWTKVRSMPVGVNHPAVAAYKGSLYVHGGYTGVVTQPIDRLFRYTPATDTWVELKNSGRPRVAHALVPIGGKLYAPGGADGQRAFRFLQLYDPARDRWRSGPAMRVAREHIGAAAVDGKLYVIAGRAGGFNLEAPWWDTSGALAQPCACSRRWDRRRFSKPSRPARHGSFASVRAQCN
jgi:N-acetylneuraminic acid mutarotase